MTRSKKNLSILAALLLGSSMIVAEAEARDAKVLSLSRERVGLKFSRKASSLKSLRLKTVDQALYQDNLEGHDIISRALMARTYESTHYGSSLNTGAMHFETGKGRTKDTPNMKRVNAHGIKSVGHDASPVDQTASKASPQVLRGSSSQHNQQHEPHPAPVGPNVADKENIPQKNPNPVSLQKTTDGRAFSEKNDPTSVSVPQAFLKESISSKRSHQEESPKDERSQNGLIAVDKQVVQGQKLAAPVQITPDLEQDKQNLFILDHTEMVSPSAPKAPPAPPAPPAEKLLNKGKPAGSPNFLKDLQNKNLKKVADHKPKGAQGNLQDQLLAELIGARKPRNNGRANASQGEVNPDPESVGFRFNLRKVNARDQNRFAKRLNGEVFDDESGSAGQNAFAKLGRNTKATVQVDARDIAREATFKRPLLRKVAEEEKNKFKRDLQENPQDHSSAVVGMMIGDSGTVNRTALATHAQGNQKVLQSVKYQRPVLRKVNPDEQNKFAREVAEKKVANAGQTLAENVTAVHRNDGGAGEVKARATHAQKAVGVIADLKSGFDLKSLLRPTFARPTDQTGSLAHQPSNAVSPQASSQPSAVPTQPKLSPPKLMVSSRPVPPAPKMSDKATKHFALVTLSVDGGANEENANRMAHFESTKDFKKDLVSDNPMARLKKTNTAASQESAQAILREQEIAFQQEAALRKVELAHQARLEKERLEREREAEEARLLQARVLEQQALAVKNAKTGSGMGDILDFISRNKTKDGSAAGFGLKKVVKENPKDLKKPQPKTILKQLQDDPTADAGDLLRATLAARSGAIHGDPDESDDEDGDFWD
ncbi:MAG: hypothetical protein ACK5TR_04800 [Alphaproteobacteria bacterium]|jgi:hypothetical protein|nr:hypothetical protein [Alphaproteobacteria bacterium]